MIHDSWTILKRKSQKEVKEKSQEEVKKEPSNSLSRLNDGQAQRS